MAEATQVVVFILLKRSSHQEKGQNVGSLPPWLIAPTRLNLLGRIQHRYSSASFTRVHEQQHARRHLAPSGALS